MATERLPRPAAALLAALAAFAAPLTAQDLRKGLARADAVFVGRQVGHRAHDDELTLHRVQVVQAIRGLDAQTPPTAVTVLDWPHLALHNRPSPRQTRLYCLQDASAQAQRAGLPADQGPYYKMVGWIGTDPLVGPELATDPVVRFATVLAAAEQGARPVATATAVLDLALQGDARVRVEATQLLAERPDLRNQLAAVHWSQLASRVGAETEDVKWKIALAELCAEQRLPGLVDAMVLSLGQVRDAEYARTVGRLAAALLGEDAAEVLDARAHQVRDPAERAALLLALGATSTEAALAKLQNYRRTLGKDAAVEAALQAHRTVQAQPATFGR